MTIILIFVNWQNLQKKIGICFGFQYKMFSEKKSARTSIIKIACNRLCMYKIQADNISAFQELRRKKINLKMCNF